MDTELDRARECGKTLATLDTEMGNAAEPLNAPAGFEFAGMMPAMTASVRRKNERSARPWQLLVCC